MKQKPFFLLKLFTFLLFISIIISTAGCPPSLVYSPSANLPPRPLKKNTISWLDWDVSRSSSPWRRQQDRNRWRLRTLL